MKILDFPNLRQTYDFDCGAKALQSVLAYFGHDIQEGKLIKQAKTNKKIGTSVPDMTRILNKYGLKTTEKEMTVEELKKHIDRGTPVIILVQAWSGGKKPDYSKKFTEGHYVVAIGYDSKRIIFEDPASFYRTALSFGELKKRWRGIEYNRKVYNLGIAVTGKKPVYSSKKIIHMD